MDEQLNSKTLRLQLAAVQMSSLGASWKGRAVGELRSIAMDMKRALIYDGINI